MTSPLPSTPSPLFDFSALHVLSRSLLPGTLVPSADLERVVCAAVNAYGWSATPEQVFDYVKDWLGIEEREGAGQEEDEAGDALKERWSSTARRGTPDRRTSTPRTGEEEVDEDNEDDDSPPVRTTRANKRKRRISSLPPLPSTPPPSSADSPPPRRRSSRRIRAPRSTSSDSSPPETSTSSLPSQPLVHIPTPISSTPTPESQYWAAPHPPPASFHPLSDPLLNLRLPAPSLNLPKPFPDGFRYIESSFIYGADVPAPEIEFFAGCRGTACCIQKRNGKKKGTAFGCNPDYADADENVDWLYTSKGEVNVDYDHILYDCNPNCACAARPSLCTNRVIQRGRPYPLELFYSGPGRGYGLRSPVRLPKRVVLGVYTGEVVTLEEMDRRAENSYAWDLDKLGEDETMYAVDAHRQGNLFRFLNHSCEANTVCYAAQVHNANALLPTLVIVTSRAIEAYEELTIDYGQPKQKNRRACQCGAEGCRRWY